MSISPTPMADVLTVSKNFPTTLRSNLPLVLMANTKRTSTLFGGSTTTTRAILMNVIRRILEYYFMQLCGYDSMNIRKRVLDENREKFIEQVPNSQPDMTKYNLASAMLSYISANSIGCSDGLNYVDDCAEISLYRTVFKLIFKALQQEQHYNMMMSEQDG